MHKLTLKQTPVVFSENPHGYRLGDRRLSGVTSLIHDVLGLGVYEDVSGYIRDVIIPRAADYGTCVHKAIEEYEDLGFEQSVIRGEYETYDVKQELSAYIAAKQNGGFESVCTEYTVSDCQRYASNIDNIWLRDDEIWLVDTKTNNLAYYPGGLDALKVYLSWQLSIYAYLFECQNPGLKVAGLACNWLRKGESKFLLIDRVEDDKVADLLSTEWAIDENGNFVYDRHIQLPSAVVETKPMLMPQAFIDMITSIAREAEQANEALTQMKTELREAMSNAGIKSWNSGAFRVTIGAESETETFDTKRFQQEHPDLYKQYLKTTKKKGSFIFKLR